MDGKTSEPKIDGSEQRGPLPVPIIGTWTIEKNPPYGFVIRNTDPDSLETEYHFWYESNGWFTARSKGKTAGVFNIFGQTKLTPHLCDRESTRRRERIQDLREKGHDLTEAESKELLALCGMIPEK